MPNKYSYGCVIDAGSSGSRIHVYRWPRIEPFSSIKKYSTHESSPGVTDPTDGLAVLSDLIASAQNSLPRDIFLDTVPIFLGATAGMRILDPKSEEAIIEDIRSLLHASGFLFRNEWARTISGEEEGAYGWLVANYLKNGEHLPDVYSETTYGAIDLGGASAQMSFIPSGAVLANLFPVRADKSEYSLYTHSYLYYGVDQANLHFHSYYLNQTYSPCYPVGYTDHSGISGSSSWRECLVHTAALFDFKYDCYHGDGSRERCSFNGVYQPPIGNHKFIAMSTFVYVWNFLGLRTGSKTDDLKKMIKKAESVCSMSYNEQIEYYDDLTVGVPSDSKTRNIHIQCFNAAYIYHLLHSGFGFPIRRTPIEIHNSINGTQVDWALGMMLAERNKGLGCETTGQRSVMLKVDKSGDALVDYRLLFFSITPTLLLLTFILGYLLKRARRKNRLNEMYSLLDNQ